MAAATGIDRKSPDTVVYKVGDWVKVVQDERVYVVRIAKETVGAFLSGMSPEYAFNADKWFSHSDIQGRSGFPEEQPKAAL